MSRPAPAFMLLEVVVAVGLLVLGMAVIGAQLRTAADQTYETDHLARIVMLAESRLAELDSGRVIPNEEISEEGIQPIEEDFGRLFPQYASRVTLKPTATPDLIFVQLDILYDPGRMITEKGAPLDDFDFNDDDKIVQTYYTLRAAPRPVNLKTDFGMEDELADRINEQIAQSSLGGTLDVENFDPSIFKDLELEQLLELITILQQAFGADQSALLELIPENMRPQLAALLKGLEAEGDTGGDDDDGGDADSGDGARGGRGDRRDRATDDDDGAGPRDGEDRRGGEGRRGGDQPPPPRGSDSRGADPAGPGPDDTERTPREGGSDG